MDTKDFPTFHKEFTLGASTMAGRMAADVKPCPSALDPGYQFCAIASVETPPRCGLDVSIRASSGLVNMQSESMPKLSCTVARVSKYTARCCTALPVCPSV
eukprot:65609-Chlamydomonas_euryale.AAC.1